MALRGGVVVGAALLVALGGGCAARSPKRLAPAHPAPATTAGSYPNWSLPPQRAAALMKSRDYDVRMVKRTAAGTSGAEKVRLWIDELGREVDFKVKRVPPDLDGVNNAPRKEIAAYEVQALFLDPEDYVVPTTLARCPDLDVWRKHHFEGEPQVSGTRCVLIVAALWLQDVTVPEQVYDEERFLADATYARYLADFNLLTYLIDHRDGRSGNFLVSRDDARRQVFAIDNGVSFAPFLYNFFVPNWNVLRVAALRTRSVDRLRALERADLDFLLVAQQLEDDGSGHLRDAPPGPPLDPDVGAMAEGGVVQFGLTRDEVDGLWERMHALLRDVDAGEIPVF